MPPKDTPKGIYIHDLALIKLDGEGDILSGELTWNLDPLSLHYNRPIRLLSSIRPPCRQGLAILFIWGCTIGQAVFVMAGSHVQEQIGRP